MKQKLTVIVHKFDKSLLLVKSQSDLSTLLGVSVSTIKRNYNEVGIYDTATYTVYVGAQYYDNGVESKYKHDVEPPKPKLYNSTQRTNNTELIAQKNYSNQNIVQPIIEDEPIEDLLLPSQQHEYYLNLLKGKSQEYAFKKFCEWRYSDKPRAMIIQSIADKMFDIVRE